MYHNDKSGWITGKGDSACFGLWGRTLGRVQARRKNRPRVLIHVAQADKSCVPVSSAYKKPLDQSYQIGYTY